MKTLNLFGLLSSLTFLFGISFSQAQSLGVGAGVDAYSAEEAKSYAEKIIENLEVLEDYNKDQYNSLVRATEMAKKQNALALNFLKQVRLAQKNPKLLAETISQMEKQILPLESNIVGLQNKNAKNYGIQKNYIQNSKYFYDRLLVVLANLK